MNKKVIYILLPLIIIIPLTIYFLLINKDENLDQPLIEEQIPEESTEISEQQNDSTCSIGDTCEGGIVAYIDEQGNKLIVSAVDNAKDIEWGCRGQLLDITSREYGTGKENTEALVNWHQGWTEPWFTAPKEVGGYCHEKNDGTVAARVCYELELNEYSDWYLPSIDELDLIYENVHKDYKGDFGKNEYWSSSEYTEGSSWIKTFANGDEYGYQKTFNRMVRCVRSM